MRRQQQGFTLIEIVIAFTILSMTTVLVVNLVTQSSARASRVDEHFAAMDTLETAVAAVRGELMHRQARTSYEGTQSDGHRWVAQILGQANSSAGGDQYQLKLYRVRFQVFHDDGRPGLELVTIVPNQ